MILGPPVAGIGLTSFQAFLCFALQNCFQKKYSYCVSPGFVTFGGLGGRTLLELCENDFDYDFCYNS